MSSLPGKLRSGDIEVKTIARPMPYMIVDQDSLPIAEAFSPEIAAEICKRWNAYEKPAAESREDSIRAARKRVTREFIKALFSEVSEEREG